MRAALGVLGGATWEHQPMGELSDGYRARCMGVVVLLGGLGLRDWNINHWQWVTAWEQASLPKLQGYLRRFPMRVRYGYFGRL